MLFFGSCLLSLELLYLLILALEEATPFYSRNYFVVCVVICALNKNSGFRYNKKMNKTRTGSLSSSDCCSSSDSERYASSSGSVVMSDKFAGARFTTPPQPDAVPAPPQAWLSTQNQLTFVTSDLKSMLQITA